MENPVEELEQRLASAGFRSSVVSVERLPDMQYDMRHLLDDGILDENAYSELISRYGLDCRFGPAVDFPEAQSIIITAVPQPKVGVTFTLSGTTYRVIIPPTYIYDTDKMACSIISQCLLESGYKVDYALVPGKALAVRSGLAAYGKNNITYIEGLGSFFRLRAFVSDVPCSSDTWRELKMMDRCEKCTACIIACPTGTISEDRFLVDATRCITYLNEGEDEFPEWIDPAWHNCLVGCMICQDICPANADLKNWIVEGEEFSEEETQMILKGVSPPELSRETTEKLRRLHMLDYIDLLQRNLRVLLLNTAHRPTHSPL